jgi:hypothetical protein
MSLHFKSRTDQNGNAVPEKNTCLRPLFYSCVIFAWSRKVPLSGLKVDMLTHCNLNKSLFTCLTLTGLQVIWGTFSKHFFRRSSIFLLYKELYYLLIWTLKNSVKKMLRLDFKKSFKQKTKIVFLLKRLNVGDVKSLLVIKHHLLKLVFLSNSKILTNIF